MAFRNIPPNGFPALPDVEDLEAVVKDVTTLKSSVSGLTEDVSDLNEQKANQITIAPFFNSETSYDIGDLVYYNGLTYRCINAHEGEWDADDFTGTTIANELDTLKSGLTNVDITSMITLTQGIIAYNLHAYADSQSIYMTGVFDITQLTSNDPVLIGTIDDSIKPSYDAAAVGMAYASGTDAGSAFLVKVVSMNGTIMAEHVASKPYIVFSILFPRL